MSTPRSSLILAFVLAALPSLGSVEDTWKDLYSQAQRAAALKDYAKSEDLYKKALHEAERFGENDVRVASTSGGLAVTLGNEKKYSEAEAAAERAASIYSIAVGNDSLEFAEAHFDLAVILLAEGKAEAGLQSLGRLLPIYDRNFSANDVKIADALCMQGNAFLAMKRYASAEVPLKRCSEIREEDAGVATPEFGDAANSLAIVYQRLGKYKLAESYFNYAETIRLTTRAGIASLEFAETLEAHASLLRQLGHEDAAKKKEKMAAAIRSRAVRK